MINNLIEMFLSLIWVLQGRLGSPVSPNDIRLNQINSSHIRPLETILVWLRKFHKHKVDKIQVMENHVNSPEQGT